MACFLLSCAIFYLGIFLDSRKELGASVTEEDRFIDSCHIQFGDVAWEHEGGSG